MCFEYLLILVKYNNKEKEKNAHNSMNLIVKYGSVVGWKFSELFNQRKKNKIIYYLFIVHAQQRISL